MSRAWIAALALGAGLVAAAAVGATPGDDSLEGRLRAQLAAERVAHRDEVRDLRVTISQRDYTHRRQVAGLRRTALARPSVDHALRLAATAYGVPLSDLRAVARCESGFSATAYNGIYGATGLFQWLRSSWLAYRFGQAGFDRTDPYASALQTAEVVSREGWRQWVCRP